MKPIYKMKARMTRMTTAPRLAVVLIAPLSLKLPPGMVVELDESGFDAVSVVFADDLALARMLVVMPPLVD